MTLTITPHLLTAFLMAMVRAAALLMLAPPFNTRVVPNRVKVGFAAALGVAAAPRLAAAEIPLELAPLVTAAALQVATGLALGFMVLLLYLAVSTAGGLLDIIGGLAIQPSFDPMQDAQTTSLGRLYSMLATVLLFSVGGHLLVMRGFLASFEAVPLGGLAVDDLGLLLTEQLSTFMLAALEIGGPVIAALFVTEIAMALMARAAPQMNVFLVAMPLKILITVAVVGLSLPLLPGALGALLEQGVGSGLEAVGAP